MSLTLDQARKEVKRLKKAGTPYSEISKELAKKGYFGAKTGKPLGVSTISSMAHNAKRKTAKANALKTAPREIIAPKKLRAKLNAVRTVLALDMEASEKVAMAQLVLE